MLHSEHNSERNYWTPLLYTAINRENSPNDETKTDQLNTRKFC